MYHILWAHKTKLQNMQGQMGVYFYTGIKFEYPYKWSPNIFGLGPQCFICWPTELGGYNHENQETKKVGEREPLPLFT